MSQRVVKAPDLRPRAAAQVSCAVVLPVAWRDRHAVLPTGARVCDGSGTDQATDLGLAHLPERAAATAYAARAPAVCGTCLRGLLWFFRAGDVVAGVEAWRKSMGKNGL